MKKRLIKKWHFLLCSHYSYCVENLDFYCVTNCKKMFSVSKRQKNFYYRFCKKLKQWKHGSKNIDIYEDDEKV